MHPHFQLPWLQAQYENQETNRARHTQKNTHDMLSIDSTYFPTINYHITATVKTCSHGLQKVNFPSKMKSQSSQKRSKIMFVIKKRRRKKKVHTHNVQNVFESQWLKTKLQRIETMNEYHHIKHKHACKRCIEIYRWCIPLQKLHFTCVAIR